MSFEFGIFDSFDRGVSEPGVVLGHRLDFAVEAERLGIERYHVTEHHGTPLSVCPSPNVFLAALSQRTTHMRLGALVYVLPAYDPVRLAEEIATLDQFSDGRLDVGVGSGVSPYELGLLGVDPEQARALCDETLIALRGALRSGRMAHRGTLLRDMDADLAVHCVQRPHPPLWYASSNTRTAGWAGANAVNFVGRWNGGAMVPAVETFRGALPSADPGRPAPRIGVQATVYIADTDAEARARYRAAQEVFAKQLTHLWHQHGDHRVDAMADPDAGLQSGTALVGTAATVRDALLEQLGRAPMNYVEALLWFGDLSSAEATANLRAFASEVAPAIRERAGTPPAGADPGRPTSAASPGGHIRFPSG